MLWEMKIPRDIFCVSLRPGDIGSSLDEAFRWRDLKNSAVLFAVHSGIVGKSDRTSIGIASVVEVDAIVSSHLFHGLFEGNHLWIEVARSMGSPSQSADDIRRRVFRV